MKSLFLFILLISTPIFYVFSAFNDAEIKLYTTNIEIDNGKLIKNYYCEIQINNRAGEKFAKVKIPYSKLEKLSGVKARITDVFGTEIRKLKNSEIVIKSAISGFSFYEDNYVEEFVLKHNSYPYIVEYGFQITQKEFLHIEQWSPVFDNEIPTRKATLNVLVPIDFEINYNCINIEKPNITFTPENKKYSWTSSYNEIITEEVLAPALENVLPSITIVPKNFFYNIAGSFESWKSYGNWQFELLQDIGMLPDKEKNKVTALLSNITDEKEKIKILYHYLQDQTRYVNIKIETGGLRPYSATYVAENKYGDCKALSNYFKALLDFAGIKSYYTQVYAGSPNVEVNKAFPSQQFNHIILFIPLKKDTIWLDCTSKGPFNYLGTFTQNRNAFVIDKDKSSFVRTPSLHENEVLESRFIKVHYVENSPSEVSFKNSFKGYSFEKLISFEKEYSQNDKSIIARNFLVDAGFDLLRYDLKQNDRDSLSMNINFETNSQKIYQHLGNDIIINNIKFEIPEFEKPENRKLALQIDFPIFKIDTIYYDLVSGFALNRTFKNQNIESRFGRYSIDFVPDETYIKVIKKFILYAGNYESTEYKDVYNFYKQVSNIENKIFITQQKSNE